MVNESLPTAISIMGPTASGKTDLAIQLTKHLPCELISVDSALIYKGMDIGTAKPSKKELADAPHALVDILDPAESYSVADFRRDALAHMQAITQRGNIPILVGGTMMYFKALVEGISKLPKADEKIRQVIEEQAKVSGWQSLHDELMQIDPVSAKRIHPNDPQRLSRAIEVFRISGKSMTELTAEKSDPIPYNLKQFSISPERRDVLHNRIAMRFQQMLDNGFVEEVVNLRKRNDLNEDLPSIRCVGYRQVWQHLNGDYDYDEMVAKGIAATRQLAKRQLTWLRSWNDIIRLDTFNTDNVGIVLDFLEKGKRA